VCDCSTTKTWVWNEGCCWLNATVKSWFDSAKGFVCAVPNEPGHPDVFLTDVALRAAGVVDPKRGMSLVVTFDASHAKPRALVVRLS
jgi:cold shock CspA family protein